MQPHPQPGILVQLRRAGLRIIRDFGLQHAAEAGALGRGRARIDDGLNHPFCAQDRRRAERQNVRGAAAFGFVLNADAAAPALNLARWCSSMLAEIGITPATSAAGAPAPGLM